MEKIGDYANELKKYTKLLEGPTPIRIAAAISALALAGATIYATLDIREQLADPPNLLLKGYMLLFSIGIAINELKSAGHNGIEHLQNWILKWMPFMAVVGGKGMFMVFTGTLGMAYVDMLWVFVPACCVMGVGIVNILVHFGKCSQLHEAYEQSMMITSQQYYTQGTPY